jgi:amine acid ABC transporter, permease protein, 3-TM region, His/Glu/Gln/Arg/opine family
MGSLEFIIKVVTQYWPLLLRGIGYTMLLSMSGTVVGFVIGLMVGVVRTFPLPERKNALWFLLKFVNIIINIYVQLFRCTPMMVQAVVIYYGIAKATGFEVDRLLAGFIIISINTGAYMAEIVRGGIISIDAGQFDAARAIGMTHWQTMLHVIIPQTIRNILPATGNEFVINIKDSSVLMVITVTELFYYGKIIIALNYRAFETYLVIAAVYFVLTYSITRLLRFVEHSLDGPQSYDILHSGTTAEAVVEAVGQEVGHAKHK